LTITANFNLSPNEVTPGSITCRVVFIQGPLILAIPAPAHYAYVSLIREQLRASLPARISSLLTCQVLDSSNPSCPRPSFSRRSSRLPYRRPHRRSLR